MPTFSLVVAAYGNADYLPRCLESIECQTFASWECVVVNDASPDNTHDIAQGFANRDNRFRVVDHPQNMGPHIARKTGVASAQGDFLIFVDADDELAPMALEELAPRLAATDADMLHFGIEVVPAGVPAEECRAFGDQVNNDDGNLTGAELRTLVFHEDGGYRHDWRVTQCAYRIDFIRNAFAAMTSQELRRAEDAYEFFVIADRAQSQAAANDIHALRYYFGRGITGASTLELDVFKRHVDQFKENIDALAAYGEEALASDYTACLTGARRKLDDLLMNDWHSRVADSEKEEAARYVAQVFGPAATALQLMRLARDAAYADWTSHGILTGTEPYIAWFHLAEELAATAGELPADYAQVRNSARSHIANLERRSVWAGPGVTSYLPINHSNYEREQLRIFVTTHKDVERFHSSVLQPVQVGWARPRKRLLWAYQDDTGNNISDQNALYCELTTQYWAWKNIDAEYYGFCHYRRYFDFSPEEHEENPYGEIMDGFIDYDSQKRYCLDDASMRAAVAGVDVITTGVNDFSQFSEHYTSPRDLYKRSPYLHVEDFDRMMDILVEDHPDYREDAEAYLAGTTSCFCNMFIMRKELFFRYCAWLFPLLERFVAGWDQTYASHETLRTPGHLSERLLNIFLMHERRVNPELVWKQVQCVHFEHPEHEAEPRLAALDGAGKPVVPVVFAADNAYAPMVTTTIESMLANASTAYLYDVVVLEKDFTPENKEIMQVHFARQANARLRFVNVQGLVRAYNLQTNNEHISVETYYRFLIQQVLPGYDKVLYLDSDLIVRGDVSELYACELGDNLVAAVRDIDFAGNLDIKNAQGEYERRAYARDVLHLEHPFDYFQAGVLVLNTRAMRALHPIDTWLGLASESTYIYDDQDILNAECQGRVLYLDPSWNVMIDCAGRIKKVFAFAPADMFDAFMRAYREPRIVHYAGFEKPWGSGGCDRDKLYWHYARMTPYYEDLLELRSASYADQRLAEVAAMTPPHERAIAEDSPLRRVFDGVLPQGSARREMAKGVVRTLRGRK